MNQSAAVDRRCVAIHEAGHAVAAYRGGRKVSRVSIADDGIHGLTEYVRDDALGGGRTVADNFCVTGLAGMIAEAIYLDGDLSREAIERSGDDITKVLDLVRIRAGDDRAYVESELERLMAETRALLDEPRSWTAVATIAEALLDAGTVSQTQVSRLIECGELVAPFTAADVPARR